MKNIFTLLLVITCSFSFAQNSVQSISGRITDGGTPLNGVSIINEEQGTLTSTDDHGRYEVSAKEGDVLVFGYLGRDTIRIKTEDVTRILNLEMKPKTYTLNEVTVADKRKQKIRDARAQEKNGQVIKTAYGDVDLKSYGFGGGVIDNKLLNPGAINLAEAVRNRVPGLIVGGPLAGPDNSIFFRRGSGRQSVGYDIDGMVLRDMPNFLDPSNIEKIALLPAVGAVAKYGRLGAGGMIVITTKNRKNLSEVEESGLPYDHAKRRDNIYANDALTFEQVRENESIYLKELLRSKDEAAAKKVYRQHEPIYKGSYPFLLDS